jgi:hypothetical protein
LPYVAFVVFRRFRFAVRPSSGSFWRELFPELFPRITRGEREDHDHHRHQQGHTSRAAAERAVPVSGRRSARAAEVATRRPRQSIARRAWQLDNAVHARHEYQRFIAQIQRRYDMTITIINKGTARDQQQNGPCPFLVDCPPEPRR